MQKEIIRSRNAFRDIPFMGVIWVVDEAMKLGFYNGHPDWSNLGQGQPEVGEMEGAPARIMDLKLVPTDQQYGHIGGTQELREMIADHYNRLYRKGKSSQYTWENVSVAMGGRLMLTRIFSAMDKVRLGYQIPDYTAYEDMFNYQVGRIDPILIPTTKEDGFGIPGDKFAAAVEQYELTAFVISNPCNPTGHVIQGTELEEYVRVSRDLGCTLVMDEFYSHFIYDGNKPADSGVSAAEFVEDVDDDPVLVVDGLTKSFRYPGWRIGWALGPKEMIGTLDRAASAIDGGPSQPMQRLAMKALDPAYADQETEAVRQVFSNKRNLMVEALKYMGIECYPEPEGTFYAWADISNLPEPLNNSDVFFREALKRKVMTVPGHFFDVNPSKGHRNENSFSEWVRFSFGPPEENMNMGLERLIEMVQQ